MAIAVIAIGAAGVAIAIAVAVSVAISIAVALRARAISRHHSARRPALRHAHWSARAHGARCALQHRPSGLLIRDLLIRIVATAVWIRSVLIRIEWHVLVVDVAVRFAVVVQQTVFGFDARRQLHVWRSRNFAAILRGRRIGALIHHVIGRKGRTAALWNHARWRATAWHHSRHHAWRHRHRATARHHSWRHSRWHPISIRRLSAGASGHSGRQDADQDQLQACHRKFPKIDRFIAPFATGINVVRCRREPHYGLPPRTLGGIPLHPFIGINGQSTGLENFKETSKSAKFRPESGCKWRPGKDGWHGQRFEQHFIAGRPRAASVYGLTKTACLDSHLAGGQTGRVVPPRNGNVAPWVKHRRMPPKYWTVSFLKFAPGC